MKHLPAAAFLLFAVAAHSQSAEPPRPGVPAALNAFIDICVKTAPAFGSAAAEAGRYGIDKLFDLGVMKLGANRDKSIALQIKNDTECVVTTESQNASDLTRAFREALQAVLGGNEITALPHRAIVQNTLFIFQHDRKGGEAFVMLRAER